MEILLLTFAFFGLAMFVMALGVIFGRRCLRGSCGGPEVLGPDGESMSCPTCPNRDKPPEEHVPPENCGCGES